MLEFQMQLCVLVGIVSTIITLTLLLPFVILVVVKWWKLIKGD